METQGNPILRILNQAVTQSSDEYERLNRENRELRTAGITSRQLSQTLEGALKAEQDAGLELRKKTVEAQILMWVWIAVAVVELGALLLLRL